jgi:hypothetical protein
MNGATRSCPWRTTKPHRTGTPATLACRPVPLFNFRLNYIGLLRLANGSRDCADFLTVSARRPHPLVIPRVNPAGKTFESQEHRLTVHDIRPTPTNQNLLIELSIKANDLGALSDRVQEDVFGDGFQRADPQHLQIEVIDASDHMVPWFQSGADAESNRFTLTVTNQAQPLHLKELRYYGLTRASVKIPFEFNDIPMP